MKSTHACCSVWDLREGSIVNQLETQGVVTSIEMQADGNSFFTADGHAATLWTLQDLQVHLCGPLCLLLLSPSCCFPYLA